MSDIESIITLARHYCIRNYRFWRNKYYQEQSETMSSDNDYNLFPRYNVLEAILQGVETIIDKKFISINECKKELKNIGKSSQTIFTKRTKNKIEGNAIAEERNKFLYYIKHISKKDLKNVPPLPYNRKLNEDESKEVREKLHSIWNFDGSYWEHSEDENEIIFLMRQYITEDDEKAIIEHIIEQDKRFFTVDEWSKDYETEIIEFNGNETVYTNKKFEWIIYFSHEWHIAFGGDFLLGFLRNLFSDKKEKFNKYEW
jgi:hypothetical protein